MNISVFYDHIAEASAQTGIEMPVLLREFHKLGIEAVEMNLDFLIKNYDSVMPMLENAGLTVSSIYEFYHMAGNDEREHGRLHIDTARKSGVKKIMTLPGFIPEGHTFDFSENNEYVNKILDNLRYITEYAEKYGITVTIEDYDYYLSPLSKICGIKFFLDKIPQLRFTFDTGNFIYGNEDIYEAFDLLSGKTVHVHCKDRKVLNDELRFAATGEGDLPIADVIGKFKEQGYNGYFVIEHFGADNQYETIKRSARILSNML